MLAIIGFLFTAVTCFVLAYTFETQVVRVTKLKLSAFAVSFYALGLAFLVWGLAVITGDSDILARSVLVGETLLLAGGLSLSTLLIRRSDRFILLPLGVTLGILAMIYRAVYYYPTPYLDHGVLIFNTPTPVVAGIGLLILGIWLPTSIKVAGLVTKSINQLALGPTFYRLYIGGAFCAVVFTGVRRPVTAVLAFVALTICLLLIIASNFLVTTQKVRHGK